MLQALRFGALGFAALLLGHPLLAEASPAAWEDDVWQPVAGVVIVPPSAEEITGPPLALAGWSPAAPGAPGVPSLSTMATGQVQTLSVSALAPAGMSASAGPQAGALYVLQVQPGASVALPGAAPTMGAAQLVADGFPTAPPSAASGAIYVLQVQPGASVLLPGAAPAPSPVQLVADLARAAQARTADLQMSLVPALAAAAPPPANPGGLPAAPAVAPPLQANPGGLLPAPPAAGGAPLSQTTLGNPPSAPLMGTGQRSLQGAMSPGSNCGGFGQCAWMSQGMPASRCTSDARICTSVSNDPLGATIVCSHSAQSALNVCADQGAGALGASPGLMTNTSPVTQTSGGVGASVLPPSAALGLSGQ